MFSLFICYMNWVVLIGFMGAGKSTIGKNLAEMLGFPFVDTDECIEQKENNSISSIFEKKGEVQFREMEADLIRSLNVNDKMVLAVGGGLPVYHDNMQFLNSHGYTIYLKHEADELAKRLKKEREHRPLLAKLTDKELLEYVTWMLEKRARVYEQSKLILPTSEQNMAQILDRINLF